MTTAHRPLTALLAHGKNWELPIPADPTQIQPSFDTRLTAEAAGILYLKGANGITFDRIILSTGRTAGPKYRSEARAMKHVIRERFDKLLIPDEAIIMEEDSFDTSGNLIHANRLCKEYGIGSIALLTVGYHLPRTRRLADKLLADKLSDVWVIASYKSEKVIQEYRNESDHFYIRSIINQSREKRSVSPIARALTSVAIEGAAWTLLPWDSTGQGISSKITAKLRHQ